LAVQLWRLLTPGGPRLLRLVSVGPLLVLMRQALLAAGLFEAAVLALLLLATALALLFLGHSLASDW
jgi:hypothetical protein